MKKRLMEKFDILNRWTGEVQFTAEIYAPDEASQAVKLGLVVRRAVKSGADLNGAYLNGAYLTGMDLRGAVLRDAVLRGTDLSDADLRGADFTGAVLSGADLRNADLRGADLTGAVLSGADLRGADLTGAVLSGADLRNADLECAVLTDAHLADLRGANLSGANLRAFKADLWMTLTEHPTEVPALIVAIREGRIDGSKYTGECTCLVGTIARAKGVDYHDLHHDSSDPSERWFMMISKGDKPGDDSGGGYAAQVALQWCEEWLAARKGERR